MTIVSQRYPPTPVAYRRGQNLEPGLAETVQQSAALCATLDAHVQGVTSIAAHAAPVNPAADLGHDHSGGEHGRPLFRSLAAVTFDDGRTFNRSPVLPGKGSLDGAIHVRDSLPGATNRSAHTASAWLWVPPCDPAEGAYLRVGLSVSLYLAPLQFQAGISGPPIAGDVVTLRVWRAVEAATYPVALFPISNPNAPGPLQFSTGGPAERLHLQPGAWNEILFQLQMRRGPGGGERGLNAWLLEAEVGVYEGESASDAPYHLPPGQPALEYREDEEGLAEGQAVAALTDHGRLGGDAEQAVSSQRPLFRASALNGRGAMEFDGVSDVLRCTGPALRVARDVAGLTFAAVAEAHSLSGLTQLVGVATTSTTARVVMGREGSAWRIGVRRPDNVTFFTAHGSSLTAFRPYVVVGVVNFAAAEMTLYVDGAPDISALATWSPGRTPNADSAHVTIGAHGTANPWHGLIARPLIYSRALSPSEVSELTHWYRHRYGL